MILDVGQIIAQLGKEKGIDKAVIIAAIKEALETAARKKYGMNKILEATYESDTGEFEILSFRTATETIVDPDTQMTLEEAQVLDPEAQLGDSLGERLSTKDLGRIAAQTARQIIMQKVKDAEREVIYNEFIGRKGEILNGIVQRYERDCLVIDLGKTEAIMPPSEQIPRERYRQGDRIRAYIKDVTKTSRGPEILLSRADPRVILKLFEQEVPEVYEGVVSILSVAREPGFRTKIAVRSRDRDVDPVGACVGMKGSRVQSIIRELRGEKIDIVEFSDDVSTFVTNALNPAKINRVQITDPESKTLEVVVDDEQLSLAIGKKGQNVRLASRLAGWKIDIKSEQEKKREVEAEIERMARDSREMESLQAAGEKSVQRLVEAGLRSLDAIVEAGVDGLSEVPGIGPKTAEKIIAAAEELLEARRAQEAAEQARQEEQARQDEEARREKQVRLEEQARQEEQARLDQQAEEAAVLATEAPAVDEGSPEPAGDDEGGLGTQSTEASGETSAEEPESFRGTLDPSQAPEVTKQVHDSLPATAPSEVDSGVSREDE
jgi:N utilization substance protein A